MSAPALLAGHLRIAKGGVIVLKALMMGTALTALAGAAAARAEDWRGSGVFQHDLAFVDADSIVRPGNGTIRLRAQMRLADVANVGKRGYDRVDLRLVGRCPASPSEDPVLIRLDRRYLRTGRRVAEPRGAAEQVRADAGYMIATLCHGQIGRRGFAGIEAAVASGEGGHALPPTEIRWRSEQVELTGTVVQGFEMDAINLCGSEAGCTDDAPEEFCWLQSDINVPVSAGAQPGQGGSPARHSADYTFPGWIERSASGRGFGHVGAYGCQVTATGPVRETKIMQRRPAQPNPTEPGERPAAAAAHAAMAATIAEAGPVRIGAGGERSWSITGLDAAGGASGRGNACHSHAKIAGTTFDREVPSIDWTDNAGVARRGATVVVATAGFDEALSFVAATPVAARRIRSLLEKAMGGVTGVEQDGRRVTVRFGSRAPETIEFKDAGLATEAAGIAHQLRGREIVAVGGYANRVWARPLRRVALTFADEGKAAEAQQLMDALRKACAAPAGLKDSAPERPRSE